MDYRVSASTLGFPCLGKLPFRVRSGKVAIIHKKTVSAPA